MTLSLKQAIARASRSLVRVTAQYAPAPRTLRTDGLGTGVIVGQEGWIVTALHVLRAAETLLNGKADGRLQVGFPGPHHPGPGVEIRGAMMGRPVIPVAVDESNDLALLQLANKDTSSLGFAVGPSELEASPTPFEISLDRPDEGDMVASTGYPLGEFTPVTTSGPLANVLAIDPNTKSDRYLVDMTANPGNSGGPVYHIEDAQLVGILVAGHMTTIGSATWASGLTIVVPSAAVHALMRSASVR